MEALRPPSPPSRNGADKNALRDIVALIFFLRLCITRLLHLDILGVSAPPRCRIFETFVSAWKSWVTVLQNFSRPQGRPGVGDHSSNQIKLISNEMLGRDSNYLGRGSNFTRLVLGLIEASKQASSFSLKPNFASKYSLESSRRDLYNALLCTVFGIHNRKLGKKEPGQNNPEIGENEKTRGH